MIHELDPDIAEALRHAGLRARACVDIRTLPLATARRTYRVDLESGDIIKARCLEDELVASRLFDIRRHLPAAFVPAFFQHGRILLERWVHGRILNGSPPGTDHLAEAATLLANLHAISVASQTGHDETYAWRLGTEERLQLLVDAGGLEAAEAGWCQDELIRRDPGRAVAGIGHFDLCGENMIVDHEGQLRVFDNERVGPGPRGFDLARTWYRWGLSARQWSVFRNAYGTAIGDDEPFAHLDFWRIVVLVQSACLRLAVGRPHLSVPLDRLRQLASARASR